LIQRDILSWVFRPSFLRSWGKKKDTLFAGPWIGEFGWELMNWQPFLRWLAPQYKKVIVCIREGNEALYADFAHEFRYHNVQGDSNCNYMRHIHNPEELKRAESLCEPNWDFLRPVGWQPNTRKIFKPFGTFQKDTATDILFHPRGRTFGSDRNWSSEKWERLLEGISNISGQKIQLGCIGLTNATLDISGDFLDYRDVPLEQTLNLMASTRLVIGPSSGPMHLASLCKTPHLVWTDQEKYARGYKNRYKYESWWNPFHTKAVVVDNMGFDPDVEIILQTIQTYFSTQN
jgi:hypothetical protein